MAQVVCEFTDGHSKFGMTFTSFFKGRALHKAFSFIKKNKCECLSMYAW